MTAPSQPDGKAGSDSPPKSDAPLWKDALKTIVSGLIAAIISVTYADRQKNEWVKQNDRETRTYNARTLLSSDVSKAIGDCQSAFIYWGADLEVARNRADVDKALDRFRHGCESLLASRRTEFTARISSLFGDSAAAMYAATVKQFQTMEDDYFKLAAARQANRTLAAETSGQALDSARLHGAAANAEALALSSFMTMVTSR